MRQLFKIDESEKKRILEMHENATKRNYLMEQPTTDPLVSKQGGTQITTTVDDKFGKPQTSTTNVAVPGIADSETLNKFAYGWGGETLCDKMKFLQSKKLQNVDRYTTDNYCKKTYVGQTGTGADMLRDVVDKALLNIAQNVKDLNMIASGKIGQNTMSMDNKSWTEMFQGERLSNLPDVIRAIAMEQVKPVMSSVQSALSGAKSGLSKM